MKRMICILAAIMLVFGIAGQAMAYWENEYGLQLVAFEEDTHTIPLDTTGNEVHSYLSDGLLSGSVDTGITKEMLGVDNWSDAYVAIFGAFSETDGYKNVYFSSDTTDFTMTYGGYLSFINYMDEQAGTDTTSQTYTETMADGAYNTYYQAGNTVGSYSTMLGGNYGSSDMGANVQLADDGYVEVYLYYMAEADLYWNKKNPDSDPKEPTLLATYYLITTGDTLVVSTTAPVPIPGSVVLLGSGLMGLVGIRRRKA